MNARCVVCGRTGTTESMRLHGGVVMPPACPGECSILGWEMYFVRLYLGPGDVAEVAWRWRRHVAAVHGRPFNESPPRSRAEVDLDRTIISNGRTAAARRAS